MLGVIADHLLRAVATATGLAEAGAAATITLDIGGLPAGAIPVLLAEPAGMAAAVGRLVQAGCTQILATHDPGCTGPIGALADALVVALGTGFAVACPALPASGYTLYQGYVFRRQSLLAAAAPGDQSSYVRLLSLQSDGTVGLVPHGVVRGGVAAIRTALAAQREQGRRVAVVDALDEDDLRAIGTALAGQAAVIGAPALAPFLASALASGPASSPASLLAHEFDPSAALPPFTGAAVILAGATTRTALFQAGSARDRLPHAVLSPETLAWAIPRLGNRTEDKLGDAPLLITAPTGLPEPAAAFAELAVTLVQHGVRRLLVTGAATATAVVSALGVTGLRLGPAGAGLPWMDARGAGPPLHLMLTDGDAGGRDLFLQV